MRKASATINLPGTGDSLPFIVTNAGDWTFFYDADGRLRATMQEDEERGTHSDELPPALVQVVADIFGVPMKLPVVPTVGQVVLGE